MARHRRKTFGGVVYHTFNRGSRKGPIFSNTDEYAAFEDLVADAREIENMRIVAYCLMVNHWHLLLWPHNDGDVSRFLHRLTGTHAMRYRRQTKTVCEGAVYQSRFRAVGVLDSLHFLRACRYIERNPVEAHLVKRAEEWRWSSARQRAMAPDVVLPMDDGPMPLPENWLAVVNNEQDFAPGELVTPH